MYWNNPPPPTTLNLFNVMNSQDDPSSSQTSSLESSLTSSQTSSQPSSQTSSLESSQPNSQTSENASSASSYSDRLSPFSANSTILDSEHTLINDDDQREFGLNLSNSYPVIQQQSTTDFSLPPLWRNNSRPSSRKTSENCTVLDELPLCKEHGLCKEFFCFDCICDVCGECIKQLHNAHYLYPSMPCKELFRETDKAKAIVRENISIFDKQLNRLYYRKLMTTNDIKVFFQRIREVVDRRERELLNEVSFIVNCRARILEQKRKENQEAMDENNRLMAHLTEVYHKGDVEYLLNNSRYAMKQLEVLRGLHKGVQQSPEENVIFYPPDEMLMMKLAEMGIVVCANYVASLMCNDMVGTNDNGVHNAVTTVGNTMATAAATAAAIFNQGSGAFGGNHNANLSPGAFGGNHNANQGPGAFGGNHYTSQNLGPFSNNLNPNQNLGSFDNNLNTNQNLGSFDNNFNTNQNLGSFGSNLNTNQNLGTFGSNLTNQNLSSFNGNLNTLFDNSPQYNPFQTFGAPPPSRSPAMRQPQMPPQLVVRVSDSPTKYPMLPLMGNPIRKENTVPMFSPLGAAPMPADNAVPATNMFPVSFHTRRNYARIKKPVTVFGKEGSGDYDLCRPWGVCCDNNGHVIIADRSNNRIQIFRTDGSHVRKFGKQGSEEGEFNRPAGVAIDYYGRIVVTDKDNHRVQVFTLEGSFVFGFGERGQAIGKFHYPWDVSVSSNGLIAVSDTRNHRVQVFTANGMFFKKFGFENVSSMWKFFDSPRGLCFTPKNTVMCTDFNNHRLYELEVETIPRMLKTEMYKKCELFRPQGVAMDAEGNILVSDCRNNRIQVFSPTADLIGSFGVAGKELGQFDRPSGIALTPDGKIVVVDFGNHRIQIF